MTSNHIDQLAEWWENAEQGTPREGDTYIARFPGGDGYETGVVDSDGLPPVMLPNARILARAPKPKPAWHDADAVMAVTPGRPERRVFIRYDEPGWWGDADSSYETDELAHVTPLIEAKVTDEMVERGAQACTPAGVRYLRPFEVREVLTAALGLETA